VLTGDLDQLLAAISPGTTPGDRITSVGTWQHAPLDSAAGPGTYATPVAFRLAGGNAAKAIRIAMTLAAALRRAGWVRSATVMDGYLTVSVTQDALAALAVRITLAGPACARSTALAGTTVPAPPGLDLASVPDWARARRQLSESISARLAEAAGAHILTSYPAERLPGTPAHPEPAAPGPVGDAVAFAGSWAISYAITRLAPGTTAVPDPRAAAAHHLGNPAYAVRYAHAHAASTLRQAADLGLGLGEAAQVQSQLLAYPAELWLLDELSWLPERVAGAARRARPDVLARYLERLASAYLGVQEQCPAMGPGVRTDAPHAVARLWLAAASRTALRAGLDLLGVDAPDRL
jgi:arginyl-tRNA synthetase